MSASIPLVPTGPALALGRYLLFEQIAAGGMASVHFGRQSGAAGFSRMVAIKRLHAQFAKDPQFVAMFLDEARLAARIHHPNVVDTLDVVAMSGEVFLVMEYVHGQSLAKLWRAMHTADRTIESRIIASIMSGVLHGLHAAHEARGERGEALGIVHRDVSPQNILVGLDGVARVLDFGVAKASGRVQTTREGQLKGKLAYMAPEQFHGVEVTRRTDVYAAGVVLWELLTGRRAFDGQHEAAVITAVLGGPLPLPSEVNPLAPTGFDQVVARALHHDPEQRYATAHEMALDIERCVGTASTTEVAEWVRGSARDDLAHRNQRIALIEGAISSEGAFRRAGFDSDVPTMADAIDCELSDEVVTGSRLAVSTTISRMTRRSRERATVVGALAIAVVFGAAWIFHVSDARTALAGEAETTTPSPVVMLSATTTSPSAPPAQEAPGVDIPAPVERTLLATSALRSAKASPALPGAADAPSKNSARTPPRAKTPARPTTKPPKADCDPPFTVDENGHKHYKAACL